MGDSDGVKASAFPWRDGKWHCIKISPLIVPEELTFKRRIKGISGPWNTFLQIKSIGTFLNAKISVAQISVIGSETNTFNISLYKQN